MNKETLLIQAKRILDGFHNGHEEAISETIEFLHVYAGEKSSFYKSVAIIDFSKFMNQTIVSNVKGALLGFINYVENDLYDDVSIQRRIQIETVSDFLEQANSLLNTPDIHPGAPAMLIGAALEEFLRNWGEEFNLKITGKPGIENYAKSLIEAGLINKQDHKDITSWGGLRNEAAHGKWEEVNDKKRISLMFEGVNLFMRKYTR